MMPAFMSFSENPLQGTYFCLAFSIALYTIYIISHAIYNVLFHPLCKYPGSRLWAATDIPRFFYENVGTLDYKIREMHQRHGHIIRYGPNSLSMTTSAAYKDLHGYGINNMTKDPAIHRVIDNGQAEVGIIQADNTAHAKQRRQLAHAFSERALREQESLVQRHVDVLIAQLGHAADSGDKVDMCTKLMYTTSDITSELSFGTSFDSLTKEDLRPLVHLQDSFGGFITRERLLKRFPLLKPAIMLMLDTSVIQNMKQNRIWVREVVDRRLEQGVMEEKKDFLSYVLKHKDEAAAMTDTEIRETSRTMIAAGAETTRTVLAVAIYLLLSRPQAMEKLKNEVRNVFSTEASINFRDVSMKLPFMLACLDEAMRLHTPVPSHIMARVTPPDGPHVIAGEVVPAKTSVVIHPLSTMTCSRNFADPLSFRPERWMDDKGEEFRNDDRAAFQPFSYGPRNCIGRNLAYSKMRLVLARLLWNFDLELCRESVAWDQQKILGFWQNKPLWVRVQKRQGL